MIFVIRESLDQFVASTSGSLSNQKLHEYICRQLPVSGKVTGNENVVLDTVGDEADSLLELSQDVVMRRTGTSFKCVNGGNQFHHLKGTVSKRRCFTETSPVAILSLGGWAALCIDIKGNIESKKRYERERAYKTGRIVELIPREHRYGRSSRTTFWHPVISFVVDDREYEVETACMMVMSLLGIRLRFSMILMIQSIFTWSSTRKTIAAPASLSYGLESSGL